MEVIIGVTVYTAFFSVIYFGFSSIVKLNANIKNRVYQGFETVNEITEKYYLDKEE